MATPFSAAYTDSSAGDSSVAPPGPVAKFLAGLSRRQQRLLDISTPHLAARFVASIRIALARLLLNKAGYTTDRCGYWWTGAAKIAARLFQGSHDCLITQILTIFKNIVWTDRRTHPFKSDAWQYLKMVGWCRSRKKIVMIALVSYFNR